MKKYNLKKKVESEVYTINEKQLDKNTKDMGLSTNQQKVVEKNINLSLPIKDKDNTISFEKQLDAGRKNETKISITEASMNNKIVSVGDKTQTIMPINIKTEEYNKKRIDEFKESENSAETDTSFWDKYVGVQLEGTGFPTKVDNNVPSSGNQLANNPDKFKGENVVSKEVIASIKDADAMLFHIYATVARGGRNLTDDEKQQIIDINYGKRRLIREARYPISGDVKITEGEGGVGIVFENGQVIDTLSSVAEAKTNYPEGEIESSVTLPIV